MPSEAPVSEAHPARREGPGFGARLGRWWKRRFAPWAREVPARVWQWLREWVFGLELVTTALAFAVPAVAYMATVYDNTWGTDTQWLAAFAAGFLGTVVINWGAVWFVQSAWTHFPKPKKPSGGTSAQNS